MSPSEPDLLYKQSDRIHLAPLSSRFRPRCSWAGNSGRWVFEDEYVMSGGRGGVGELLLLFKGLVLCFLYLAFPPR